MNTIAIFVFFSSLLLVFYVYAGYPLAIAIVGHFRPKSVRKEDAYEPFVTILIPAHNEEYGIKETVANKLTLDYPANRFELLVISDGSEDQTDAIVADYGNSRVTLLRQEPRAGKTMALNMAVPFARGEILVFSDANSIYSRDALRKLVRNFAEPNVGYVTGRMIYTNDDGSAIGDGCSAYMKYENLLRRLETRAGSVVGVDGGIDAMRRELYRPMEPDHLPDFILPLHAVQKGYRVIYEHEALLKEAALDGAKDERAMRTRVTLRALWALHDMRHLLSPVNYGLFAVQLWSHKVLRYLCFLFLIGAFASSLALWRVHYFFRICFLLQACAYAASFAAPVLEKRGVRIRLLYMLHYFVVVNFGAAAGLLKFMGGHKQVLWTPRKG